MALKTTFSSERGAVLVHVALGLLVFMAFTTFVVDYGVLWVSRRQAQNAADAGAMAGAIAWGFDDREDLSATGPAKRSAFILSQDNFVWGASPDVQIATDITFPVCPDGINSCLRVDVYRTADRGNPLPMFFGRLLGLIDQDIRATATAQVRAANATRCLKPWAIADKWEEYYPEPSPWTADDRFEKYDGRNGPPLPNPDVYEAPDEYGPGTGFTLAADYGTELVLKAGNPNDTIAPGWFFPLQLTESGGNTYRDNIANCADVVWGIDDEIPMEPGNMIGPTMQGVRDLIALDPNADWDWVTETVTGSCVQDIPSSCPAYYQSPRVVVIPVIDTDLYEESRQTGRLTVKVVNLLGFFLERVQGNDIYGRLVSAAGLIEDGRGGVSLESAFTLQIILVR